MGRPDGRRPLPTCEIGRPVPGVDGGRTPGHAWHPVVPCVTLRRNIAGFTAVALRTARWSSPGPVAVDGSTGLPACLGGAGLPLIRHCDELVGVGPPRWDAAPAASASSAILAVSRSGCGRRRGDSLPVYPFRRVESGRTTVDAMGPGCGCDHRHRRPGRRRLHEPVGAELDRHDMQHTRQRYRFRRAARRPGR